MLGHHHPIRRAWRYSRTIFLNVTSILLLSVSEIVSYLTGANWASVIENPKILFLVTVGINVLNVILRIATTTAIGQKPPCDPAEPEDPK